MDETIKMRKNGVVIALVVIALAIIIPASSIVRASDPRILRDQRTSHGVLLDVMRFTLSCPWIDTADDFPRIKETRQYTFHITNLGQFNQLKFDYERANPGIVVTQAPQNYGWYAHVNDSGWDEIAGETSSHYVLVRDTEVGEKGCITGDRSLSKTTLQMVWSFYYNSDLCRRSQVPDDIVLQCELVDYIEPEQTIGF